MYLVSCLIFSLWIQHVLSSSILTPRDVNNKTTFSIGVIFPNLSDPLDTKLVDSIVTSEVALKLAAESIENQNILPGFFIIIIQTAPKLILFSLGLDVQLNITRFYSSMTSAGITAWEAFRMSENHIK